MESMLPANGIFLLRPELAGLWDYRIFVDVSFDTALERAIRRDRHIFHNADEVRARYQRRYFPAQRLYLEKARPRDQADAIVENDVPERARLIVRE